MPKPHLETLIRSGQKPILLYGITPPKADTDPEKVADIARKQVERIQAMGIDGLVLYDIQDEASRTAVERPFPFMATLDAFDYARDFLSDIAAAKIIYRAVGKYQPNELKDFLTQAQQSDQEHLTVFVGAAAKDQAVSQSIHDAYQLKSAHGAHPLLGGVTISERHDAKGNEHERVFDKMDHGCSFFISQGVYDVNASKNFLSDYYYFAKDNNRNLAPIIFTLTPCGSVKTLEFMKWLGISIPRWLENELLHAQDILAKSVQVSLENWLELKAFAEEKNIPIGCNIESVSVRKVEIDASVELMAKVKASLS